MVRRDVVVIVIESPSLSYDAFESVLSGLTYSCYLV
jgi:hypothetical protein